VRRLRRLVQKRSYRWEQSACVLEGRDLVAAALDARAALEAIYLDEIEAAAQGELIALARRRDVSVYVLESGVLERIADAQTPQPVLASVALPLTKLEDVACEGLVLALQDVRDPGNAGTLVRSADAAGASGVVFCGHSVDPFNPKTLRATAGSIFHLPIAVASLEETLRSFSSRGASTYATVVRGGRDHRSLDYARASVVVIGNESEGLNPEDVARCDAAISIAMAGASESLNAGVAGSLIAFESLWRRQVANEVPPTRSL
jgi:TrmH family RNA methyltransferase